MFYHKPEGFEHSLNQSWQGGNNLTFEMMLKLCSSLKIY